eukprot:3380870-Pleurochrysis_carterae.AAC.1
MGARAPPAPDNASEQLQLGPEKQRGPEKLQLGPEKLQRGPEKLQLGPEKLQRDPEMDSRPDCSP